MRCSRWNCSSLSTSAAGFFGMKPTSCELASSGFRSVMAASLGPGGGCFGRHGLADCCREALPPRRLVSELASALRGEVVILGSAVVLGDTPLRFDPSFARHAIERGIERAFLDAEDVVGGGLDPAGDAIAVHRSPRQRFEDQQFDGAL